jgi:putative phage-type endonuclease
MNKDWHEWRRQGIGGSDAPVVMGVSPWKTPHQLWQEKLFGISEQPDSSSMKRGRDLEETARQAFEKEIGTLVAPSCVVHPGREWMRASLDGVDITGKIMVEIKCPNRDDHFVAVNKKVPEKYIPQCQHQMAVTGLEGMYYFSFDGSKGVIVEVARDQEYIDSMVMEEIKFWDLVLSKTPPALTERDCLCMESNKEWKKLAKEALRVKQEKETLEEKYAEVVENLKYLSQGRSARGHGIILQKQVCLGSVDYSKVPELFGVNLEQYRKKSFEKWPLRVI